MGRTGAATTARARAVERRRFVLQKRKEGLTFQAISEAVEAEFGKENIPARYGSRWAYKDLKAAINEIQSEMAETAMEMVWTELNRLDALLEAVWPKAMDGDVRSIEAALKISRRRSSIVPIDMQNSVDTGNWMQDVVTLLVEGKLTAEQIVKDFDPRTARQLLAKAGLEWPSTNDEDDEEDAGDNEELPSEA